MRRSRLTPLRIAIALGVVLSVIRFIGCAPLARLDTRAVDFRLIERGPQPAAPEVVIVAIDDASLEKLGRWPWPRSVMAKLVDRINAGAPAVVGFDIVQSEASASTPLEGLRERIGPIDEGTWGRVRSALQQGESEDRTLATALEAAHNGVLGYFFDFDEPVPDVTPLAVSTFNAVEGSAGGAGERHVRGAVDAIGNLPALSTAAAGSGYFNMFPDPDGLFRRVPLVIRYGDAFALPLSLAMLQRYWPDRSVVLRLAPFGVASVRIGDRNVPVAEDGQLLLNYRGPRRTFPHISASDLLDGSFDVASLREKLVLVGVTASAVADVRATAFDPVMPGVEIHATVLDNVLRGEFLLQPKWVVLVEIGVIFGSALALGLALRRARGLMAAAVAYLLVGLYLGGTQKLFTTTGIPLGMVFPIACIVLVYTGISVHHYIVEASEKRKIRNAFGLYLNPELARQVSERPEMLRLGGEKRVLTVLFSDIRGFTSISERLDPSALVELLNVYLGKMTDVVFDHEGTLDKYIGDAIMAIWGAPIPHDDHAARASRAAVGMVECLEKLHAEFDARGWPRLETGIGLHTGEMIVGNMGSVRRLSYTVMGDNVNLGSRLEGLTKYYHTRIIASEDTVRAAGDGIVAREIDLVRVKGKAQPVRIFDVLGLGGNGSGMRAAMLCSLFAEALTAYRERRWQEALASFQRLHTQFPEDGPTELYIERCRELLSRAPSHEWDGVTVMETK